MWTTPHFHLCRVDIGQRQNNGTIIIFKNPLFIRVRQLRVNSLLQCRPGYRQQSKIRQKKFKAITVQIITVHTKYKYHKLYNVMDKIHT